MIPTHFCLHGLKYSVVYKKDLVTDNNALGEASYRRQEIFLQELLPGVALTEQRQEQVFYHELTHHILHHMSHKLRDDEGFVELFSSLLHQAMSSMQKEA
jgi:predicted SprT family Zn-dependent metalloprotease